MPRHQQKKQKQKQKQATTNKQHSRCNTVTTRRVGDCDSEDKPDKPDKTANNTSQQYDDNTTVRLRQRGQQANRRKRQANTMTTYDVFRLRLQQGQQADRQHLHARVEVEVRPAGCEVEALPAQTPKSGTCEQRGDEHTRRHGKAEDQARHGAVHHAEDGEDAEVEVLGGEEKKGREEG